MKSIIGNNNGRRKPVDLTGKILADAQSYKPQKDLETKTNESPIIQPSKGLSFVTDPKMYLDLRDYICETFPDKASLICSLFCFKEGALDGSTPYSAITVDMYLKSINSEYRIATQLDLEQDLDFTKDTYNDSGLALRNLENSNKEQAIHLFNQLKQRGVKETNFPLWINLRGLEIDKNLNFNLTNESFYKTAECLNWADGTRFSKINEFGLPSEKDENSTRQIWTENGALMGCKMNGNSNFGSYLSDFSHFDGPGRVALAKENKNE